MGAIIKFLDSLTVSEDNISSEHLIWIANNKASINIKPNGNSWYIAIKVNDVIYSEDSNNCGNLNKTISSLIKKIEKEKTINPIIH